MVRLPAVVFGASKAYGNRSIVVASPAGLLAGGPQPPRGAAPSRPARPRSAREPCAAGVPAGRTRCGAASLSRFWRATARRRVNCCLF
ncbi:hypothetical protein BVIET440_30292 [Burkholderia vietnamiensis]